MKLLESLKLEKVKGFIIILYTVGIIGSSLPFTHDFFIVLTPVILLLSFAMLLNFHTPVLDSKTSIVFIIIFLISFLAEVAGVRTGQIFGTYSYGRGLGLKLFNTPLLIGLNWVMLVYCTAAILEKIPVGSIGKIAIASLLMVLYDLVMEQVAPPLDMWAFSSGFAPLRNYISWFILAVIFHSLVRLTGIRLINRLAPLIFYCQAAFFIILFIFYKIVE
jgi:bisanhydrobacterioruberin hydratase